MADQAATSGLFSSHSMSPPLREEDDEDEAFEIFMYNQDAFEKNASKAGSEGGSVDAASTDSTAQGLLDHLGPPLKILPKTISAQELAAYRADYQAFRSGKSRGARGEISQLDASNRQRKNQTWGTLKPSPYEGGGAMRPRKSLVPLIGVELASSSAARSAVAAAGQHRARSGSINVAGSRSEHLGSLRSPGAPMRFPSTATGYPAQQASLALLGIAADERDAQRARSKGAPLTPLPIVQPSADSGVSKEALRQAIHTKQGLVLVGHVLVSLTCLLPALLLEEPSQRDMLVCPLMYVLVMFVATLRVARGGFCSRTTEDLSMPLDAALAKVLHMERLINDGFIPQFFVLLCAFTYAFVAAELVLTRVYSTTESEGKRFPLFGNSYHRYDYACVGSSPLEVADCIIVRHAASATLLSFYTCLFVVCVCNRSVQGNEIVVRHKDRLLELFPNEAEALFSYIEASITSNDNSWRSNRRYSVQSMGFALGLTILCFSVYMGLLSEAASRAAQATFLLAVPFCYAFHFVLLRYVFLQVLLNLEGIKARAAALAYCDEEGVLPFDSGHAVYVWFSIRRNATADNEIAFQRVTPIFATFLACAIGCSMWLGAELLSKGMSIFALTCRGGSDLIIVAYALISCFLVAVFLQTFLDIGKLEEAHLLQLRVARLRVEHARRYPAWNHAISSADRGAVESAPPPHVEVQLDMPSPSAYSCNRFPRQVTWPPTTPATGVASGNGRSFGGELQVPRRSATNSPPVLDRLQPEVSDEDGESSSLSAARDTGATQDLEGAAELLERVLQLLEQHGQKPSLFGVEIGQKTFQVINAALTSHAFAVLVWGVLVPSLSNPSSEEGDINLVGARTSAG
mmetsp:Transcript_20120/g.46890  ORF Transcript_20120/g.46890 Transcript_20120/m.46890 type:complete len:859 (-) Transcript_20120:207-2783(-)|eukprot:CAMPEP_0178449828 /NCGR_PEP_ID=MMETSP0689_2-20121128/42781_1 /TAXON_ID=160604 /ORGANISM="Amphidinium massartii, Strain CS-259" /LENGTH=858 /DNA_ID=CAMNT_0020075217 /DNA_START=44 /DNA_END=2620 /DNA_ORIENTATION=+